MLTICFIKDFLDPLYAHYSDQFTTAIIIVIIRNIHFTHRYILLKIVA